MNYSFRLFQAFSHDRKNYPFCQERKKRFSYQQSWQEARQPLEQSVGIRMPEVHFSQEHGHAMQEPRPVAPKPDPAVKKPALLLAFFSSPHGQGKSGVVTFL